MTNIADCLQSAANKAILNPVRAREARVAYRDLLGRYETIMPKQQAAASAAADLKEATRRARRARFHAVMNQLQSMRRIRQAIEKAPDPAVAIRNLMEYSEGSGYTGESVKSLTDAYVGQINATIHAVLKAHSKDVLGNVRDIAGFEKIIDELHGTDTGNAEAKVLAKAIRKAQDQQRRNANAHGADIGELADYGIAHTHDPVQLIEAGFAKWADDIESKLAWHRITDARTGKPFVSAPGMVPRRVLSEPMLAKIYANITTRGWDGQEPTLNTGTGALYNRLGDHRELHFNSGAEWRAYNKEYGAADPFSGLINGLHGLARDVAMMRVLGPNPRQGLRYATQVAEKRASELDAKHPRGKNRLGITRSTRLQDVTSQANLAGAMLSIQNGDAGVPGSVFWARVGSGTRGVLTSAQLGSAVVSSITDQATMRMGAKAVGMNPNNLLSQTTELVASAATRETAAQMGFVAETLAEAGAGSARYFGRMFGTGITERLANGTLRATGLTFLTDMRKIAWQMGFSAHLAQHATAGFDQLPVPLRRVFESRGISPADWDALRDPAHAFTAPNGAKFITGYHWLESQTAMEAAEAIGLSTRLDMAMREFLQRAVPEASLEVQARLRSGTRRGTIGGEVLGSVTMYRSFALTLMIDQWRHMAALDGGFGSKLAYAAELSALLVVLGALAIQLKEISKGRDPRPMTDMTFWGAAVLQGGGLGIFGDFFGASTSRAGSTIPTTLAGPVAGLVGNLASAIGSNASAAIAGENTFVGRDVANLVRRNTPFLSSGIYTRLAFDRWGADTLQRRLDPEAQKIWDRQQRQQERDRGNRAWFGPGQAAPARAPDLSNIAGARQ